MICACGDSHFSSEEMNSSCGFHSGNPLFPEPFRGQSNNAIEKDGYMPSFLTLYRFCVILKKKYGIELYGKKGGPTDES